MSLIASFITSQLLKALEAEFESHSDELKDAFVNEVETLATDVIEWVKNKVDSQQTPTE